MSLHTLLYKTESGQSITWMPTTLNHLGKSEDYLETVLAESPSLLGLETRRSGIRQPFQVFRQLPLPTPSGRVIYPDIVFLAASGHVVVVEVKLSVNSELRDRSVIAQIIDYAASFSALNDDQHVKLFATDKGSASDWHKMVHQWFPEDDNPDELADTFLERMRQGELNLVIACDKIPPGTEAMVASIASQRALGFDLDLVETRPFVCDGTEGSDIVFASSTWLETRIVGRTAVTINYREGDVQPSASVLATSMKEIEDNIRDVVKGEAKRWTTGEIEESFQEDGDSVALDLLHFCKNNSYQHQIVGENDRTKSPTFGYYLSVPESGGEPTVERIFSCTLGWGCVYVFLGSLAKKFTSELKEEFFNSLEGDLGNSIDMNKQQAGVKLTSLEQHLEQFKKIMLWLKNEVE